MVLTGLTVEGGEGAAERADLVLEARALRRKLRPLPTALRVRVHARACVSVHVVCAYMPLGALACECACKRASATSCVCARARV